jgi:hypothetical protein
VGYGHRRQQLGISPFSFDWYLLNNQRKKQLPVLCYIY